MGNHSQQHSVGRAGPGAAAVARLIGLPVAVLALAAGGCGTGSQVLRPLTAESFAAPPTESRSIGNPLDRPGPVNYDQIRLVGPAPGANGNGARAGTGNGNGNRSQSSGPRFQGNRPSGPGRPPTGRAGAPSGFRNGNGGPSGKRGRGSRG